MSLHSDIMDLRKVIEEAQKKVIDLQKKCSHPVEALNSSTSRSNSEWDDKAYYTRFCTCGICGFSWSEDAN
jgi:hypothetical protein